MFAIYTIANPLPQVEYSGRLYRVTLDILVPTDVACTEAELREWIEWELNVAGSIPGNNPLIDRELVGYKLVGLENLRAQKVTEWGPRDPDGGRKGVGRIIRDGEHYAPRWVEPTPA